MGRSLNLSRFRAGIALLVPNGAARGLRWFGGHVHAYARELGGRGPQRPRPQHRGRSPRGQSRQQTPPPIATDATYAPNEFVDPGPGNIVGWDPELAKDVCAVLGVACTINNVTFSDIIPALLESPAKYQMAFSSFTPTSAREAKGIDFITYYQAGEAWLVKAGGASISSAADMCGHTVAVSRAPPRSSMRGDTWE